RVEAVEGVLHPRGDERALDEVLHVGRQIGGLHDTDPAFLVRVAAEKVGVLDDVVVEGNHDAFDGGEHLDGAAFAGDGPELLALPDPAVELDGLDAVDLAEELGGEGIDADASVLAAFVADPGVTGVELVTGGNLETGGLGHERRGAAAGNFGLHLHGLGGWAAEV